MNDSVKHINDLLDLYKIGIIEYSDLKQSIFESEYINLYFSKWLDELCTSDSFLLDDSTLYHPFDLFLKEHVTSDFSKENREDIMEILVKLRLIS